MFQTAFVKVKNWYLGLPWWGKIIGFLVPLLLLVLGILYLISKIYSPGKRDIKETLDDHAAVVDAAVATYEDQNRVLDKLIKDKKQEIAVKINQAGETDKKVLEGRDKLRAATTMEELDKLQKELGL